MKKKMTWKEAFISAKEDTDVHLPDGSRIEILFPAFIFLIFAMILIFLN